MDAIFEPGFEENILKFLHKQYRLNWEGTHGIRHWMRVRVNGVYLAKKNGVDQKLVVLFALLHDSQRLNEGSDREHGKRAAEYLAALEPVVSLLSPAELELLQYACEHHTFGLIQADPLVQTCWDADRLDLGRAGYRPDPQMLCTEAARDPSTIQWAYQRSLEG